MKHISSWNVYWILLLQELYYAYVFSSSVDPPIIRLGVIADVADLATGSQLSMNNTVQARKMQTELEWHHVDMDEMYQIFSTVRILDNDHRIDGIVIHQHMFHLPSLQQIVAAVAKPCIQWLISPQIQSQNQTLTDSNEIQAKNNTKVLDLQSRHQYPRQTTVGELVCVHHVIAHSDIATPYEEIYLRQFVVSLIDALSWELVYIIHENNTENEAIKTTKLLSGLGIMFVVYNADLRPTLPVILQQTYYSEIATKRRTYVNFVVLCRINCAKTVLKEAALFDQVTANGKTMWRHLSRWLVFLYHHSEGVEYVLKSCASDLDNVAVVTIPRNTNENSKDFQTALKSEMIDFQHSDGPCNGSCLLKTAFISQLKHAVEMRNSEVLCAGGGINLLTLLWTKEDRSFSTVGYVWQDGTIKLFSDLFPNTRYGLNKRKFVVSTLEFSVFSIREEVNGSVKFTGICMDLLHELSLLMNFTYVVKEPPDGLWGSSDKGSWKGLVGQLQRMEVDMVAAGLTIADSRAQVMDFTHPYYFEVASFWIKRPDPDSKSWQKLIQPYRWEVMLAVCASLPLVAILTYVMERRNPFYQRYAYDELASKKLDFVEILWYMLGALFNEGGIGEPRSFTGRTMVTSWWIFCIVIIGTYCGNLIAFLTAENEEIPFTTLQELAEAKGEYTWGTQGGSLWEQYFKTASLPVLREIWQGMVEFNKSDPAHLSPNTDVHLEKIKEGGYVYIDQSTTFLTELAKPSGCNLRRIDGDFFQQRYGVGLPKQSPLTDIISTHIMRFEDLGLFSVWKRKWWPTSSACAVESTTETKQMRLIDVQSAFYVIGIGIALASIVLGGEVFFRYLRRRDVKVQEKSDEE